MVYSHEKVLCPPKACYLPIRDDGHIYRLVLTWHSRGAVPKQNCTKCVKEFRVGGVSVQDSDLKYILSKAFVPSREYASGLYLLFTGS